MKILSDGGAVVDEEDREEAGQALQTAPERPQGLREGIHMSTPDQIFLSLSLYLY